MEIQYVKDLEEFYIWEWVSPGKYTVYAFDATDCEDLDEAKTFVLHKMDEMMAAIAEREQERD